MSTLLYFFRRFPIEASRILKSSTYLLKYNKCMYFFQENLLWRELAFCHFSIFSILNWRAALRYGPDWVRQRIPSSKDKEKRRKSFEFQEGMSCRRSMGSSNWKTQRIAQEFV